MSCRFFSGIIGTHHHPGEQRHLMAAGFSGSLEIPGWESVEKLLHTHHSARKQTGEVAPVFGHHIFVRLLGAADIAEDVGGCLQRGRYLGRLQEVGEFLDAFIMDGSEWHIDDVEEMFGDGLIVLQHQLLHTLGSQLHGTVGGALALTVNREDASGKGCKKGPDESRLGIVHGERWMVVAVHKWSKYCQSG